MGWLELIGTPSGGIFIDPIVPDFAGFYVNHLTCKKKFMARMFLNRNLVKYRQSFLRRIQNLF